MQTKSFPFLVTAIHPSIYPPTHILQDVYSLIDTTLATGHIAWPPPPQDREEMHNQRTVTDSSLPIQFTLPYNINCKYYYYYYYCAKAQKKSLEEVTNNYCSSSSRALLISTTSIGHSLTYSLTIPLLYLSPSF